MRRKGHVATGRYGQYGGGYQKPDCFDIQSSLTGLFASH